MQEAIPMTVSSALAPADRKYNGWTNIQTWLVVSRMTDDETLYGFLHGICTPRPGLPSNEVRMAKQDAKYAFREYIEQIWANSWTMGFGVINGALDEVNFLEIIECHWDKK
jgi:hypothetical protein